MSVLHGCWWFSTVWRSHADSVLVTSAPSTCGGPSGCRLPGCRVTSQRLQGTGVQRQEWRVTLLLCDKFRAARAWGIVQWAWGLRLDHTMQGARERAPSSLWPVRHHGVCTQPRAIFLGPRQWSAPGTYPFKQNLFSGQRGEVSSLNSHPDILCFIFLLNIQRGKA